MSRIGFLGGTTVPELVEAVRQGLRELRWTEGQHFVLEYRSADSKLEKISELAADLVRRNVDVIVVAGTALPYVKQATGNVPVVFVTADDPVSAGYVASFAQPGGRMTGLTSLNVSLDAERLGGLEVDHELERRGLLDWKVARVRALENAIDLRGGATVHR